MKKVGDDAVFSWSFEIANLTHITVALKTNQTKLFSGSLANSTPIVYRVYRERLDVSSVHLDQGQVTFTLRNVNTTDAGHYSCFEGFATTKLIPGCGQMLIILSKLIYYYS